MSWYKVKNCPDCRRVSSYYDIENTLFILSIYCPARRLNGVCLSCGSTRTEERGETALWKWTLWPLQGFWTLRSSMPPEELAKLINKSGN